jgi:hypothetical protein
MTSDSIREKVRAIADKRQLLLRLSQRPDLVEFNLDFTQALEEIDDLISEFRQTFPDFALPEA